MFNAVVRKCPKCKKPFFKEEGCNKMTCPCGAVSCYLCRQLIKDYTHFCRTPHCNHASCGNCILLTDSKEDDRLARREVALAEQKRAGAAAELVRGLLSPPSQKSDASRQPLQPARQVNHRQVARPAVPVDLLIDLEFPAREPLPRPNVNVQQVQGGDPPRVEEARAAMPVPLQYAP